MTNQLNRRNFIKAIAATGALKTAPNIFAATDKKWKMRLSTSSIHFMQLPIEQACQRISKLGFEAIDIWSAHEGCPHLDDVAKRLGPEGLKKLLNKHNLKLYAFSVYKGGYARYADLLGKAGGGVAIQGSSGPCKPNELTAKMKQFIESLKPLIELAQKNNSYLAIENHGNALLSTIDSFKAFTDINTSKHLGLALAPYHLQTQKASIPEAIRICNKQLLFFYAWQHHPNEKQFPGIGPTDMTPWLKALSEINYPWYVNPFMHGHPEPDKMQTYLEKSRDYLNNIYTQKLT